LAELRPASARLDARRGDEAVFARLIIGWFYINARKREHRPTSRGRAEATLRGWCCCKSQLEPHMLFNTLATCAR